LRFSIQADRDLAPAGAHARVRTPCSTARTRGRCRAGPDAIAAHFQQPIGGEWNVKFARLDSEEQFTGKDGRVVERGDFAITAGVDDSACYAGSYLATWAPDGDAWRLQMLTWQDLETDLANCK
jgi:hypothetical protein